MALAITESFAEMVLEVETTTPGVYTKLCGMIDVEVSRKASVDTSEVPDCADETLPLAVAREVRSIEVTLSASGVWAQTSNKTMSDWFYSSAVKNVRVRNTKAAVGDPETEYGPALLTMLKDDRKKGSKIGREIAIEFDGVPLRSNKV
jgi:Phage tail tube protein